MTSSSMLILIVEDHPLLASSLKVELESAGHETMGPADTFGKAVGIARQRRPELALVNIDLRDGDSGIDVARVLGSDLNCPTLFVSGSLVAAREAKDIALGFISKPYDGELLLQSVEFVRAILNDRVPDTIPPGLELFQTTWSPSIAPSEPQLS